MPCHDPLGCDRQQEQSRERALSRHDSLPENQHCELQQDNVHRYHCRVGEVHLKVVKSGVQQKWQRIPEEEPAGDLPATASE